MIWSRRFSALGKLALLILLIGMTGLTACGDGFGTNPEEQMKRAEGYYDKGEINEAVIVLKTLLQEYPDNIKARWLLGKIYLDRGQAPSAEKEFRRAVEFGMAPEAVEIALVRALLLQAKFQDVINRNLDLSNLSDPERAELMALLGSAYLFSGNKEQAGKLFDAAWAIDPNNLEAIIGKARLAYIGNDHDEARRLIETALEQDPDFASAWYLLGALEISEQNFEAAEGAYTKAMRRPEYRDKSQLGRAHLRIRQEKYAEAEQDVDSLRGRLKDDPRVAYVDGLLNFQKKQFKEAKISFDSVLGKIPNHPPALFYSGVTNAILGNYETARDRLSRHLALSPHNVEAREILVQLASESGNQAQAQLHAKKLLEQVPDHVMAMGVVTSGLSSAGDNVSAVDLWKKMVARKPEAAEARLELGKALLKKGEVEAGLREMELALELDPQSHAAAESLVHHYLQLGMEEKALALALSRAERHPSAAAPQTLLGLVFLSTKRTDEATRAFQQALALEPDNIAANSGMALIAIQRRELDRAETYYRQILKSHPKDIGTLTNLARLMAMKGDTATMVSLLEEALERDPQALKPGLMLARHHLRSGKRDPAIITLRRLVSRYPDDKAVLRLLSESELAAGRYSEAESTLVRLAEVEPRNARVHFALAQAYEGLKKRQEARGALEKATALDPGFVPARLALARLELVERNAAEVESLLAKLKEQLGDDDARLLLLEAQLADLTGDRPGALALYRKLFNLEPSRSNLRRLSQAQWRAGEKENALRDLEAWLEDHPQDELALLEAAHIYLALQRTDEAVARYQRVLRLDPDNILALNNLASLLREKDPESALEYAERAYALAPEAAPVMDTLAAILLHTGDSGRAARLNEKALAKRPNDPSFLYLRAQILAAEDERDEAARVLTGILGEDRDFPERAEAEAMLDRLRAGS